MANEKQPRPSLERTPSLEMGRGAYLHTMHMERTVRVYGVLESELDQVSMLNTLTAVFASVGSFLLGTAVSIVISWATQEQGTQRSTILVECVAPLCALVALICYAVAGWAFFSKRKRWEEIGAASEDTKRTTPVQNDVKQ